MPKSLPALVQAIRIQEKVKQVGFEWENKDDVWKKVEEESNELKDAIETKDSENIEEEFGDLMFALINYARFIDVNPENALSKTNKKFIKRFNYIESKAKKLKKDLDSMTLEEMDALWEDAKLELENR